MDAQGYYPPAIGQVVQARHAGAGFKHAAGQEALLDTLGGRKVNRRVIRIERSAVTGDDVGKILEIEAGRHFLGDARQSQRRSWRAPP